MTSIEELAALRAKKNQEYLEWEKQKKPKGKKNKSASTWWSSSEQSASASRQSSSWWQSRETPNNWEERWRPGEDHAIGERGKRDAAGESRPSNRAHRRSSASSGHG